MYGRGRGSYLGLLLESQTHIGKSAVGTNTRDKATDDNITNEVSEGSFFSPKQSVSTSHSEQDNIGRKSPQPTWTSMDLLGNQGKRSRRGSDSSPKPAQEYAQVDDEINPNYNIENELKLPLQSGSNVILDEKPKTFFDSGKKILLISPQEFLLSPQAKSSSKDEVYTDTSEKDSSSETNESSTTSSPSRYVPPHRRKGFSGKPEIFVDPAVTKFKKLEEVPRIVSTEERTEAPQTLVESELNWQKLKLERNFKKLLNSLSVDNVVGLNMDVKRVCEKSQLSTKFPGTSEINVLVNLLVARVIEQKERFEVTVQICQILNAMYTDEFPANLKDVLGQYRQETFRGVVNKNASCENFCIFLGKLCDVAKNETKSFKDCLRQSVIGCLHEWISQFQSADECSPEAKLKVLYLCYLLEVTKNVLSTEKRSWIKSCFGKIKNCILSEKVERSIKEGLLDHVIKCSLQSPATKESENQKPTEEYSASNKIVSDDADAYKNVKKMLSDLQLSHLLEKFQDNLIRDTLLCAGKNELKNTLQEASFAPGAILEIQMYIEKNGGNFLGNGGNRETPETKLCRDIEPQEQVNELEQSLKQMLSIVQSEKLKQDGKENEGEMENQAETTSTTELRSYPSSDVKENDDMNCIYVPSDRTPIRPPPGLPDPTNENHEISALEETEAPSVNPDLIATREVSFGEQKTNIMQFKDEKTQAGNPIVNWTQNMEKSNERTVSKNKGRGRGRRDNSGSLEGSRENIESQGFSVDSRGLRWNPRDVRGPHQRSVGGNSGYNQLRGYNECFQLSEQRNSGFRSSREAFGAIRNTYDQEPHAEFGSSSSFLGRSRGPFGSSAPIGCFICGAKDHRSAYCRNNAAMFD